MSSASPARRLLLPLVPLYRLGLALRDWRLRTRREPVRRLGWPVISIGNLSTGGAGKTPLTIALAKALTARGILVDVLSRGYGRTGGGAARVDPEGTAEQFGDEPLVIARETGAPVYVAAKRYEAGLLAEEGPAGAKAPSDFGPDSARLKSCPDTKPPDEICSFKSLPLDEIASRVEPAEKGTGFSPYIESPNLKGALAPEGTPLRPAVHLLDDGFQHRQLHRDVNILLLTARDLNDRLLPAGNLREPLASIRRADVIAIPADESELESAIKAHGFAGHLWRLRRQMDIPHVEGPVVAFCGIARPDQFFAGLKAAGLHIASRVAFRDHHRYIEHDIDCLRDAARSVKAAAFITTEKDRVRLGAMAEKLGTPLKTAQLRTEIEDESAAIDCLLARIR